MGARLTLRVVLLEGVGLLAVGAAVALWLQIPDSHAWEFGLSMVSGVAIVVGFLWLETAVIRRVRLGGAGPQVGVGMAVLAGWLVLWRVLADLVGMLEANVSERAGFWNSRLPAHGRSAFPYERLVEWQNDAIGALLWFVLPGLLLPLLVETVSGGSLRVGVAAWRRWAIWAAVAVGGWLSSWSMENLIEWHPSETVRGELWSAVGRMGLLYCILLGVGLIVLAIVAEMLQRTRLARVGRQAGAEPLA